VSQPASIELNTGPDRPYRVTVGLLWLLVLVNIGSHAATLAWPWLPANLLLLALLHPWLRGRAAPSGRVQIFRDGMAITSGGWGTWKGQGWASSWATILRLEEPAGRRAPRVSHVLICASRNAASDYRRLLVWNRYPPTRARSIAAGSGP
jgi:hypothetical protein